MFLILSKRLQYWKRLVHCVYVYHLYQTTPSFIKDVKSSSLIDLELADYQRSIDGLKEQLTEKQETISKLEQKMITIIQQKEQLQQERGGCGFNCGCGLYICDYLDDLKNDAIIKEEMATKLKAMLRKSTKDLTDSRSQVSVNRILLRIDQLIIIISDYWTKF